MWAMYIATHIEEAGHTAEIIDLTVDKKKKVHDLESDLLMTTSVTPNISSVLLNIVDKVPQEIPIVIGGAHVTHIDLLSLKENLIVVKGEAEPVIHQLLNDVVTCTYKSTYIGGISDVSHIRKPARHLVNLHNYHPAGDAVTPIYSSRGCVFDCAFCSRITGTTCRKIPLGQFSEEIDDVKHAGFNKFVFGDDNATVNYTRLPEMLDIIDRGGMTFRINQDSRGIKPSTLHTLHAHGCTDISFGIESGSQILLDAMNKRSTVSWNTNAINDAKSAGIKTRIYLISNFPGETEQTVKETIRFVEDTQPDSYLISNFAPMPGSYVFNNPAKYGINWMSPNWSDYYLVGKGGMINPCFTTKYLTIAKQRELHNMLVYGIKDVLS
jgi:radical SAM superfamily enzyme YgiQ (UPF0313 family)